MSGAGHRFLIVDGHSMVFAWDDLRELHELRPAMARQELVNRLTSYQDVSDERVVLVFDGKSGVEPEPNEGPGVQVIYSGDVGSADAVIERLVIKYAKKHRLTVASRDRAVLEAAGASGADCISARGLSELLERARSRLGDLIKRRTRNPPE